MKIGIFDPYLDTLSGGEKYMLSIANCLSNNHEVFIFWDKKEEDYIKKTTYQKLGLDISSVKFYANIFGKNVSSFSRFVQSRKFDAIIYLSDGSIPVVGTNLYIHFQFPTEWIKKNSVKNKIKIFFIKSIFCNSYFTKSFIDKKFNIQSKVLYPPININSLSKVKKENIILHVGRFDINMNESNYKKQDIMIDVFKKMVDKGLKNWKFIIVVGIKESEKNKLIKLNQLIKNYPIEIVENPPHLLLWKYYSKAKIYWHATGFDEDLQKNPEKAEHFGITTVEAMGAGAVPIVINAGGQKEIVEDGRNGYLWDSLNDFSEKTFKIIENKELLEELSKNAIERSKIFAEDRFCKDLKNII